MNIKIVSEKTGLTKKAIKYYESEGLINPLKNNDNNYREYTDNDIVKLNLIGALRAIEIPISEIKCLVDGNKNLQDIMNDTLKKVTETINNLEKTRLVISNILDKETKDYYSVGEQVRRLRETLELSVTEKKEFISNTLIKIFPGNFGRIFVSSYEPFLNITIDNNEKKDAWLKLVEFLDDLDELDDSNPFIKGMGNIDMNKIEDYKEQSRNNVINLLSGDENLKEKYKNSIISFVKSINGNEELKKNISESLIKSHNMLNGIGASDNTFDEYLEILNDDYKRYREIGKEINKEASEEIKNEFGVSLEDFFKSLMDSPEQI